LSTQQKKLKKLLYSGATDCLATQVSKQDWLNLKSQG